MAIDPKTYWARARLATGIAAARFGWIPFIVFGLLLCAAAITIGVVLPLQHEHRALRQQYASVKPLADRPAPSPPQTTSPDLDTLDALNATLPLTDRSSESVRAIFTLAAKHQLAIVQSDYQTIGDAALETTRIQANVPIRGQYPAIRAFVEDVLRTMPHASIDALNFKRASVSDSHIEARVRLTLFLKNGPTLNLSRPATTGKGQS
ncbi:MAG TPA: hypothetical protein VFS42_11085 [Burkholderiaceae bacterium]|nr:hypothetical protein [Burkholderiaceae bacterium]